MSSRWRPRSRGPGGASGPPARDTRPWWAKSGGLGSAAASGAASSPPDRPDRAPGEDARFDAVAVAATAVQDAADQHDAFEAVAAALGRHGLSGHLAVLDPTGEALVVRTVVLPWAWQAQVERAHGGPMVGLRIDAGPDTAHGAVVRDGDSMHAPEPLAWVLGSTPGIVPAEADAIGALIGLGEACLAPITDGRTIVGVLTVWAPTLSRRDRSVAEILGRLAGGALAGQRAREAAWSAAVAPAPASATALAA